MKANRNFKQADEAVSPVIGVILMVAITVVLAAVVFVLVNDLGSSGDSAPVMGISQDEGNDRLNIDKAPAVTSAWSDYDLTVQGATVSEVSFAVSSTPTDANYVVNGNEAAGLNSTNAGDVSGGDYIEFCTSAASALSDVTIVLTHTPSGQVVKRTEFNSIAEC